MAESEPPKCQRDKRETRGTESQLGRVIGLDRPETQSKGTRQSLQHRFPAGGKSRWGLAPSHTLQTSSVGRGSLPGTPSSCSCCEKGSNRKDRDQRSGRSSGPTNRAVGPTNRAVGPTNRDCHPDIHHRGQTLQGVPSQLQKHWGPQGKGPGASMTQGSNDSELVRDGLSPTSLQQGLTQKRGCGYPSAIEAMPLRGIFLRVQKSGIRIGLDRTDSWSSPRDLGDQRAEHRPPTQGSLGPLR